MVRRPDVICIGVPWIVIGLHPYAARRHFVGGRGTADRDAVIDITAWPFEAETRIPMTQFVMQL